MKLSTKICCSMGVLAFLMAILGIFLLVQMNTINEGANELASTKKCRF